MGLDFTPFPHFSCSQQFDLSREMLVQHEYAPKSGSTVTSCRLDLEQRIIVLQIGPPRGKCRPDLLQYRQLNIEVACRKFPATDGSTLVVWLDHPSKCYSCNRSFNVAQRSFLPVYDFWQKVVDIMSSSRIINWRSLITSLNCLLCEIAEFRELQPWIFTAIFRYYVKVQKLRITAMSAISNWNCLFDHRRMMVNSFNSKPPVWSFGRNHML